MDGLYEQGGGLRKRKQTNYTCITNKKQTVEISATYNGK